MSLACGNVKIFTHRHLVIIDFDARHPEGEGADADDVYPCVVIFT
jgi:hypothetical protein